MPKPRPDHRARQLLKINPTEFDGEQIAEIESIIGARGKEAQSFVTKLQACCDNAILFAEAHKDVPGMGSRAETARKLKHKSLELSRLLANPDIGGINLGAQFWLDRAGRADADGLVERVATDLQLLAVAFEKVGEEFDLLSAEKALVKTKLQAHHLLAQQVRDLMIEELKETPTTAVDKHGLGKGGIPQHGKFARLLEVCFDATDMGSPGNLLEVVRQALSAS